MGEHAYSLCKVRMDKVIKGEQGEISKEVGWQGGGDINSTNLQNHYL